MFLWKCNRQRSAHVSQHCFCMINQGKDVGTKMWLLQASSQCTHGTVSYCFGWLCCHSAASCSQADACVISIWDTFAGVISCENWLELCCHWSVSVHQGVCPLMLYFLLDRKSHQQFLQAIFAQIECSGIRLASPWPCSCDDYLFVLFWGLASACSVSCSSCLMLMKQGQVS